MLADMTTTPCQRLRYRGASREGFSAYPLVAYAPCHLSNSAWGARKNPAPASIVAWPLLTGENGRERDAATLRSSTFTAYGGSVWPRWTGHDHCPAIPMAFSGERFPAPLSRVVTS